MHDLRRTGATMLGELGYDSDLIDLCLNHKETNDVTATYQLQKRLPERKAAFEALGEKIIQVVGGYDFLSTLESRLTARRRSDDQSGSDEETCPPSSDGTQSVG